MPAKKGKKGRKVGRNAAKCKVYRASRAVANKRRKLYRHRDQHPSDGCCVAAIQRFNTSLDVRLMGH